MSGGTSPNGKRKRKAVHKHHIAKAVRQKKEEEEEERALARLRRQVDK